MSRDTTGQPVTASGTGKSTASKAPGMPPVPGPDAPSDAGNPAAMPASIPVAKAPAGAKKSPSTPPVSTGGAASGPSAPARVDAPASATSRPVDSDAPAAASRETKVPRTASAPEKASAPSLTQKSTTGPRRVRLAVSRLDPWSVMKLSFLLSIAVGIMIVVASVVFWMVLDGLHVFTEVNDMIVAILGEETKVNILQFVELKRVLSLSTMIAIVDVVLLTALSTIAAFLYNVVAALVGGVHLTLTDE